jgi:hypothetical protein
MKSVIRLLPPLAASAALVLTACSGPGATSSSSFTPTQEAISWFQAVNRHDLSASLAHFEPAQRHMGDWDRGETPVWGHFENVRCQPAGVQTSTEALVRCTFHFIASPGGDNSAIGDTFWTVHFHRSSGGLWLIENYGQP